jgi:hypothetical protein
MKKHLSFKHHEATSPLIVKKKALGDADFKNITPFRIILKPSDAFEDSKQSE